jgi:CorA-like Mg2+ transporter protein
MAVSDVDVMRLRSVAADATGPHGSFRALAGQRLEQFAGDYFRLDAVDVPGIGAAGVATLANDDVLPAEAVDPAGADTFQVELAGLNESTAEHARDVLGRFFDEEAAEALLRVGLAEPMEWSYDGNGAVDAALGPDVDAFDVCIATYAAGRHCVQHGHLVVSPTWLVCLWDDPCDDDGGLLEDVFPLPGSRVRHHFTRTDVTGSTGPDRLARLLQDVMRHNEYQAEQLTALIDRWELRFFRAYGAGTLPERDETLVELQAKISELRGVLGAIHLANKTLWRRAQNQRAFPEAIKAEIVARCGELEQALQRRRGELRESFALLANAAAEQQARAAQGTEARVRALTSLATFATGIVLGPGLLMGLYGADVLGLPGQGKKSGLVFLIVASILAAVVTSALFARVRRLKT